MIQDTLQKASLAELFSLIEKLPGPQGHLFRGQRNAAWSLIPTLYRLTPNIHGGSIAESFNVFEAELIDRFFREGLPYLPPISRSYSNDRALAQHFGAPTRLLDWSEDPLVATFFAVEQWETTTDAAVFMIIPEARFRPEDVKDFKALQSIAFRPPAIDRRIPAQRSMFTFHPHEPKDQPFVPLEQRPNIGINVSNPHGAGGSARAFAKIVIPQPLKEQLFLRLSRIGIDRRNLFPGLDGVGADTAARALSGQWM
ncbi:FRG domain-containing protein [Bradyrhizobium sp. CB2312]|uniref:FRG domain-containing protein n=1 Tax=Bradyrhizobium sp. CB2312 TaxID=3039155 RepID=UPI0024B04BCC|nr:FRG domain-containing protein [Bradyrhizobium sp. CB2312]WFU76574.1 FRG domain-containing protein [Bradyrhizobium sp. CB2312]